MGIEKHMKYARWKLFELAALVVLSMLPSRLVQAGEGPLVLYVGEPSDEQATQAREQVAKRLGYTAAEVTRALPLVENVFGNADLWPQGGATHLCPEDVGDISLSELVKNAGAAIDVVEPRRATELLSPLIDNLACIAAPVTAQELSRAAFLLGYARFASGDREGAGEAFKAAAIFDPEIAWDVTYPPEPQQVFNSAVLDALRAEKANLWPAFGAAEAMDLQLDGGDVPADGTLQPGLHQITTRTADGQPLRMAVEFPAGGTIRLVPLREQIDGFLAGKEGTSEIGGVLVAILARSGDAEAYIIEPAFGRIYRFHRETEEVREIPGAGSQATEVAETTTTQPVEKVKVKRGKSNPGPVVVIAGAVTAVVGAIVGGAQQSQATDIWDQVSADNNLYDELNGDYEAARTGRNVGIAVAGVGGVMVAVGIPIWATSNNAGKPKAATLRFQYTTGADGQPDAALFLTGRW